MKKWLAKFLSIVLMTVMMVGIVPVEHVVFADTVYRPNGFSFDAELVKPKEKFMLYCDKYNISYKDNVAPENTSGISLYFDGALYSNLECTEMLDHFPVGVESFFVHAVFVIDQTKGNFSWDKSEFITESSLDNCIICLDLFV